MGSPYPRCSRARAQLQLVQRQKRSAAAGTDVSLFYDQQIFSFQIIILAKIKVSLRQQNILFIRCRRRYTTGESYLATGKYTHRKPIKMN